MNADEARKVRDTAMQRAGLHAKRMRDQQHLNRMTSIYGRIKEVADSCKSGVEICVNRGDDSDRIIGELQINGYVVTTVEKIRERDECDDEGEESAKPYNVYAISWKEEVKDA